MSLPTSISNAGLITVSNGILSIYDRKHRSNELLYSCFVCDLNINHGEYGKGTLCDYKHGMWTFDFVNSSSLINITTKDLLSHLN